MPKRQKQLYKDNSRGANKPPKAQQAAIPTQREVALRAFERMRRRLPKQDAAK